MQIQKISISTAEIDCQIIGKGKIGLVIEMGLGAVMGEWTQLAERLSDNYTVLLYERAGYGSNGASKLARTPENIALELHELLEQLAHEQQITILAHSQGGLYAQKFARMYPDLVKELILLDPLSPQDNLFRSLLTEAEFQKSGVDKTSGLRLNYRLARMHLGWLIRKFMRSAPPFYYYDQFTQEETEYILAAISKPQIYQTALEEYRLAHDEKELQGLDSNEGFPQIPLTLITHDSAIETREIMEFGRASEAEAEKIEQIWQDIMGKYLDLSELSRHLRATNSSHYIHLTDADLICETLGIS
ncbi:MAG: alpha/beta fold hydrolase [Lachnospiraceae bacterium]